MRVRGAARRDHAAFVYSALPPRLISALSLRFAGDPVQRAHARSSGFIWGSASSSRKLSLAIARFGASDSPFFYLQATYRFLVLASSAPLFNLQAKLACVLADFSTRLQHPQGNSCNARPAAATPSGRMRARDTMGATTNICAPLQCC